VDQLLDSAPCGFITFADDGVVIDANSTLLSLLGYTRDQVLGRHIEQLFNVGTRIFYQTHWFPLLRLHGHAEEVFLALRSSTGETLSMLSYARRREDGQRGAYDCVLVVVRERAKYEEELLRARRAAEESNLKLRSQQRELEARTLEAEQLRAVADEANRAKSAFLATMSHELRTPLNAIGGYLQIMELEIPGPLTDAQRDIVTRLDQSSRHLLRLINEVLNLARIEAGHVEYDIQDAAARDIVAGILPMIEPQFADKEIRFSTDVQPDLSVCVDVEKTQQILLNLLSNAVKFTPPAGAVTLRARGVNDSRRSARFQVIDTGIGIPDDQIESIFEPFVQVDDSRTRTAEGTGLGLAISRDLARGMNGDLWAESRVGEGSTFTLSLPGSSR
jgi:PAS domain S-box-containing protein